MRPFLVRGVRLALAAALAAAPVAGAQLPATPGAPTPAYTPPPPVDSTQFRGMQWRSIGPERGGRSIAVAGSAARPLEYYFGAVGGGLWKTTDGGQTWKPVTDGQLHSSSVGAVAVSESNPDVIWIGMGETCIRGNIMQGDGVYRSTDGGKTWVHVGLENTQAIAKIRVDPKNPDVAWVAAFGHPAGRNPERGIYKTTDGGKSWRRVLYRDDHSGAIDLSVDAKNPDVMYAALWDAYRITWQMSSGGAGSGLFKSTDGGETWTELTRNPGMPKGVIGRIGVSVSPVDGNRVYAVIENAEGGVFVSDDAGATWKRTNDERKLRQRAFYYTHVTADPQVRDRVYVQNVSFFRSDDGGVKFDTTLSPPHGDNHALWIAPNDNQRMIEGNDGGGTVSVNGGKTWTDLDFPTAQLYHVATTREYPYHVCGAQQDNSTMCLPSKGWENLREPWTPIGRWMYEVGGGESGYIAPDPKDPNVFYAGSQGALITRYDRSNGQIRDVQIYPRFFSGEPASALPERWQWTFPIVFAPTDPRTLYATSQHLWKTTDEGQSWTRISPDLTRADPTTLGLSGGPITHDMNGPEIYGTIFAVAPSPLDGNLIWTGSDDGLAYLTRDGGKTWTNVTPTGLPKFARISIVEASHHAPGTAYLAAKNYLLDDRAPYVYRTSDFGRTWTRIVGGVRADDYAHVIREDPTRAGLLYLGTEHGVYVSWDDGGHWQALGLGLPDVQVSDIVVEASDLVIGTHGRSAYVLDDIAPIREAGAALAALRLFAPHEATRSVDESAVIQYALGRAADSVKVEIVGPDGAVVRTFSGGGAPPAKDTSKAKKDSTAAATPADSAGRAVKAAGETKGAAGAATASGAPADTILNPTGCEREERRGETAKPYGQAGLNRFTWDLRWPGAATFSCMILWSADARSGPLALPGRYQVRVTANGATQTAPLVVRMDPRLKGVTEQDLQAQFALMTKIRDRVSEANEAVLRIRRLRSGIADRVAKAPALASSASPAVTALRAVEDSLYQTRNRSGQDPLNFPIRLNNRLAALGRSVETGDARPTNAAYKVYDELAADLRTQLAALDRAVGTQVAAFNRAAQARGLAPVTGEATTADTAQR